MPRLLMCLLLASLSFASLRAEEPFVVHEWGVWVRKPAAVAQGAKPNAAYSDIGPPVAGAEAFPAFVLQHQALVWEELRKMPMEWDKPVLHFYGPEGQQVKVTLKVAQGTPTAYWPKPTGPLVEGGGRRPRAAQNATLIWEGTLQAAAPADLPKAPEKHWWNDVRAVPGLYLKTAGGSERFLFYEATAKQQPTLKSSISADVLTLENLHTEGTGPVLVIVNDGTTLWWTKVADVAAKAKVQVQRVELQKAPGAADKLLEAARAQWQAFGMTKEEAAAIVESWKSDLTKHVGVMVVGRLPRALYDQIFPLSIEPKPAQLERAGVIFDTLPGEADRVAWLPGLKAKLDEAVKNLSADDFTTRTDAKQTLAGCGELVSGLLLELSQSGDLETRNAAKSLLEMLQPKNPAPEPPAMNFRKGG